MLNLLALAFSFLFLVKSDLFLVKSEICDTISLTTVSKSCSGVGKGSETAFSCSSPIRLLSNIVLTPILLGIATARTEGYMTAGVDFTAARRYIKPTEPVSVQRI